MLTNRSKKENDVEEKEEDETLSQPEDRSPKKHQIGECTREPPMKGRTVKAVRGEGAFGQEGKTRNSLLKNSIYDGEQKRSSQERKDCKGGARMPLGKSLKKKTKEKK